MPRREQVATPRMPGSPLLGSARDLQRDQLGTYERAMRDHGDVVRFRIGPPRLGFEFDAIFDPEGARQVLSGAGAGYIKDAPVFAEFERYFGEGVFTSNGEPWRQRRRTLQPIFTKKRVAEYVPAMGGVADELTAEMTAAAFGGEVDLLSRTFPYALDVMGTLLFGDDLSSAGPVITQTFPILNAHASRRGLAAFRLPAALPTPANLAATRARGSLRGVVDQLVSQRDGTSSNDLLGRLKGASDPETGAGLTDEAIRDELMVFLAAGVETPASALAIALHLLGRHPDVQSGVREEVRRVAADRALTAEDLDRLPYTRAVVDESLRLYPPAHTLPRRATTPDVLHGCPVTPGRVVAVSIWGIHRNPKVWDDPSSFRPERFLDQGATDLPPYGYLPFGGGPRKCIGIHFAQAQLVLAVAAVVRALHIDARGVETRVTAGVATAPDDLGCTLTPLTG